MLTLAVDSVDVASLMPLETPILKVSRPVAACSRCRNAKIKCDGKLPACSSCEKNGRASECTSTNDQFARGKERSYVSTLETRVDKLQAKLEEARARKPSVVSLPDDDQTAMPSRRSSYQVQESQPPHTISKAMRRKEVHAIDDLVSDFGFLSVNATARDYYGFTSAMSYARLILSACSKDPLPEGMAQPLPARNTASTLIQHYFNNVFTLLPVFDEASFWASVDNVYSRSEYQTDPLDHFFVRIVLALANSSISEQRGDPHSLEALGHACAALDYAEEVLHPGSIPSVQALVLLTEFAMLNPHHFDSWSLIGAASRAMVDLGLHQDPPKGTQMPKAKLDLRRRVFYCVYNLDRSTSIVQTRAFSFSDDSTKVKIPSLKSLSAGANPVGMAPKDRLWLQSHDNASTLIKLRMLQSEWYRDLFQSGRTRWDEPYPYLWDTCSKMRQWFDTLPSTVTPQMRAFFELDLLYSYIYVLGPSPRVPVIDTYAQKLIFEYCIRYADLILRLICDSSYTSPLTFYDAMRVYMTGRQFIDVLQWGLDDLLRGHIPPLPQVKPTTAPPPLMPAPDLPAGDFPERFNITRSIACIKKITEALSRFGMRWGYMSWHQRYQKETSHTLDELNMRLWDFDSVPDIGWKPIYHVPYPAASYLTALAGSNGDYASADATGRTFSRSSAPSYPNANHITVPFQQPAQEAPSAHSFEDGVGPMLGSTMHPRGYGQVLQPGQVQPQPTGCDFNTPLTQQPNTMFNRVAAAAHPSHQLAAWNDFAAQSHNPASIDEDPAIPPKSSI